MIEDSQKLEEAIADQKLEAAIEKLTVKEIVNLSKLSTKNKKEAFLFSCYLPGGGFLYLQKYKMFFILFFACLFLFILSVMMVFYGFYRVALVFLC